jgi:AP-2 complex subunit alpha
VTLLINESSDLIRLVVNSIKKDLEDIKEVNICLALQAVANLGGREIAEALAPSVFKVLAGSQTSGFPKKKAALCLLRLYRKHPDVVPVMEWADPIIKCMDDYDLGVNLSALHLIMAMAKDNPEKFAEAIPKVVHRLYKLVVDKEYTPDNLYYTVPAPWLQLTGLRFLMQYPPPTDSLMRTKLESILSTMMAMASVTPKNVQQNNAMNAVLLDAISFAVHMNPDSDIVLQGANLLCRYLMAKETNMRYLALENMVTLAAYPHCLEIIQAQQDVILRGLKDKDISVRKRALDLIYCMCDASNSRAIVDELVQYLCIADYTMKEEMVLKIAILTEKFATEPNWYLDVILQLLTIAGDQVSNEVWYRVIQIVTNTASLREYASKRVLKMLKEPVCHESVVKVASYILGEFGDSIAGQEGCSPADQFLALKSKYHLCSAGTRAIILSTYVKYLNLFPEIKTELQIVFQQHLHVLDSELQQRASEYLALSQLPSDDLLQTVFEQMPPFPERESALVQRLRKQLLESGDRRALAMVQRDSGRHRRPGQQAATNVDNITGDLLGLEGVPASVRSSVPHSKIDAWYNDLLSRAGGVLYEDETLQLGIKADYSGFNGRLALFIGNKSNLPLKEFLCNIGQQPQLQTILTNPINQVSAGAQVQLMIETTALGIPVDAPQLLISYQSNGVVSLPVLKLPIAMNKFTEPILMGSSDFFGRWKQIGGPPKESQEVLKVQSPIATQDLRLAMSACNIGVLDGVDPNPNNITLACVINTKAGRLGCLGRIEANVEQKMYRLTIRSTSEVAAVSLKEYLKERMARL